MQSLAARAYSQTTTRTASDRDVELQVFTTVTQALKDAANAPPNFVALAYALNRNLELWTLLTVDLSHPDNRLPTPLKSELLMLSNFVRVATFKILEGTEAPSIVIEINEAMIAGLAMRAGAPQTHVELS